MSPSRVRQLDRTDLSEEHARIYDAILESRGSISGPFQVWLHSPEFADLAQQLGKFLRFKSSLHPRLSELAILVTSRAWDCQLEWTLHEPVAREAGLTPEIIDAVRLSQYPEFLRPDEQAVYDYSAELVYNRFVQERTFSQAMEAIDNAGIVELTGIVGYYSMVAMTLNGFQIPLPEDTKPSLVDCPTFR
ncbi:MAG: carboxymuconolactone decarboxylase family protein [Candidatus Latescibacterota bacterium]|nr:carboxymuconolactone decarboxylase family protein [Candidatus Latescibacterota bacterium]